MTALRHDTAVVEAEIGYLPPDVAEAEVRVYPQSSGLETVSPETFAVTMPIRDLRSVADRLSLDKHGFEFHAHESSFRDFYDASEVKAHYYPEVANALKTLTGAIEVFVFDHNVRSSVRAARGEPGVREPVDQAHNDYTDESGPVRKDDILKRAGRRDLAHHEFALVNLWRPIIGPVQDTPLALCDAATVARSDLVKTKIYHFTEGNVTTPNHSGEIFSLHHNPAHRWLFASEMRTDEVLLLKCFDSRTDGRARFMPHTGFKNPDCPKDYVPRESIEARTLVIYA